MTSTTPVVARPGTVAPPRRSRARAWRAGVAALGAAAAGAMAVAASVWGTGGGALRFEVWDAEAERVVYARDVASGEAFLLEHVHSVHRRPVVESFSVQDQGGIALEEIRFDIPGANLPSGPERVGEAVTTFVAEDGGYRVVHHGRAIGTLPLRAGGPDVDHTLTFADGEQVRLLAVARRGAPVELRVTRD